jgi:hypothetical protein
VVEVGGTGWTWKPPVLATTAISGCMTRAAASTPRLSPVFVGAEGVPGVRGSPGVPGLECVVCVLEVDVATVVAAVDCVVEALLLLNA